MLRFTIPALLLLASSGASAERVPPADQCAPLPGFSQFRTQLQRAINGRDRDRLLALVADDIVTDFGGDPGRTYFAQHWGLANPRSSRLWSELGATLRLGCARGEDNTLYSPSLFVQIDRQEDGPELLLTTMPGAALRARASANGRVLARLNWEVLRLRGNDNRAAWLPVALASGRRGFVHRAHVRSVGDFRAAFSRTRAGWRMTAFVAGD